VGCFILSHPVCVTAQQKFFSANPFHRSLPFLLQECFPGLFTDTSELIRFYFLFFIFFHFSVIGSVLQNKLICQLLNAH